MMLPRMQLSPVPMNTMSGLLSLTATAPTDALAICPSVTGAQSSPPSVVFQSPPPAAPKYASCGRPLTPLTAMDRPPRSGPMLRHCQAARKAESSTNDAATCGARFEAGTGPAPTQGGSGRRPWEERGSVGEERAECRCRPPATPTNDARGIWVAPTGFRQETGFTGWTGFTGLSGAESPSF